MHESWKDLGSRRPKRLKSPSFPRTHFSSKMEHHHIPVWKCNSYWIRNYHIRGLEKDVSHLGQLVSKIRLPLIFILWGYIRWKVYQYSCPNLTQINRKITSPSKLKMNGRTTDPVKHWYEIKWGSSRASLARSKNFKWHRAARKICLTKCTTNFISIDF